MQFAEEELKRYLERLLPEGADRAASRFRLSLFREPAAREDLAAAGFTPAQVQAAGEEAYAIVVERERVCLYGARPRALLYAVYDFLRDVCGCEFAISAAGIERIPVLRELTLKPMRRLARPAFPVRGFGFHGVTAENSGAVSPMIDWLAKLKFNRIQIDVRVWERLADELGPRLEERDLDLDIGIHSLNYFLPDAEHYARHPDWYASVTNRFGRQIKFSNLASVPVVVENVKRLLDRYPAIKVLGLWPLDGTAFDPAEIASGAMSDLMLRYVNAVAERVTAVRPDLVFDHLAYVGCAAPPKETRPHPAILTSVCHYWDQSFTQPICDAWYGRGRWASEEAKEKARLNFHPNRTHAECCRDLAGWVRLGPAVVFSYYIDHNLSGQNVFNTPRVIQADLRYYRALGVQGSVTCYCMDPNYLWFYRDLHALAECLWDPEVDWPKRDGALLDAVFGAAGPAMRACYAGLDGLHNEPVYNGFRLADLLRGFQPAYQLSGYNPDLHDAVLQQVDDRMRISLEALDVALAAAGGGARERVLAVRANLEMQHTFARMGCQVLAAFGCTELAAEMAGPEKAAMEARSLELHDKALRIFNEWVAEFERTKPEGISLAGKIKAYRPALEKDFRAWSP